MARVRFYNINYDMSGIEHDENIADLPKEIFVENADTLVDFIKERYGEIGADVISDETGVCVNSFQIEVVEHCIPCELSITKNMYNNYIMQGYNLIDASTRAVENAFASHSNKPHITRNQHGDPSHISYGNHIYFFGGSIYSKVD